MSTLFDAYARYANCYLLIAEKAAELFVREPTQAKGVAIFDHNREQIEAALEWVQQQEETPERDFVLASFIDALSAIGMLRYSIREKLIPLLEQRISAAQRLGLKDMEADAYDDLGIKYAYLGYLQQAIELFEMARVIALEASDRALIGDIENHIRLAHKQLKGHQQQPAKILTLLHLPVLHVRQLFAVLTRNPFMEIMVLNKLASIYLEWGRLNVAATLFHRAILLSKEQSYRFGELDASIGLLHLEMLKSVTTGNNFTSIPLKDSREFEWSNDLLVLETLLDLAPAIQGAEIMARSLQKNNDPRAIEIYEKLDRILSETEKIMMASQQNLGHRGEIFFSGLTTIKDTIAAIIELYSGGDSK